MGFSVSDPVFVLFCFVGFFSLKFPGSLTEKPNYVWYKILQTAETVKNKLPSNKNLMEMFRVSLFLAVFIKEIVAFRSELFGSGKTTEAT